MKNKAGNNLVISLLVIVTVITFYFVFSGNTLFQLNADGTAMKAITQNDNIDNTMNMIASDDALSKKMLNLIIAKSESNPQYMENMIRVLAKNYYTYSTMKEVTNELKTAYSSQSLQKK